MRYGLILLLLLVAPLGSAQLSMNDWIGAGAYSELHIVLPEGATPRHQHTAEVFKKYWVRTTGFEPSVGPVNNGRINVWLGGEGLTRDVLSPGAVEALSDEGYIIHTYTPGRRHLPMGASKHLVIAGKTETGTLNGVYAFYRDAFGSRWLAPGVVDIFRAGYRMEKRDSTTNPAFGFRSLGFAHEDTPEEVDFLESHGLPVPFLPQTLGEDASYTLLRPAIHFSAHPAYYAERDGKRLALLEGWENPETRAARPENFGEICATNAAVAEIVARRIIDLAAQREDSIAPADQAAHAASGWLAARGLWSVSPMREARPCLCETCRPLSIDGAMPMGAWSVLAGRVAIALEKLAPEKGLRVLVSARGDYRAPGETGTLSDKVVVLVHNEDADFTTDMNDKRSAQNTPFREAVEAWTRTGAELWIADHTLAKAPADMEEADILRRLQENLHWYAEENVKGVYALVDPALWPESAARERVRYVAATLLWNPDYPVDAAYMDFKKIDFARAAANPTPTIAIEVTPIP